MAGRQLRQRPWRAAEQRTQHIAQGIELVLELGNGGLGRQVLSTRLLLVEFVIFTVAEQPLGDLQATRLALGVLLCNSQPRFGSAQGKVGVGHLRT